MNRKEWRERIARRSDFSADLVHLTKGNSECKAIDVLMKILTEQEIVGSTTKSGFICGKTPAVCFQDMPLHSIAENIYCTKLLRSGKGQRAQALL